MWELAKRIDLTLVSDKEFQEMSLGLHRRAARILAVLGEAGGTATYGELKRATGFSDGVLNHHLNILTRRRLVEKVGRGVYMLMDVRIPFLMGARTPVAYLGLLGLRLGRETPEPDVALSLLEGEGFRVSEAYVATTHQALMEWGPLTQGYTWILLTTQEIIDVEAVKRRVEPILRTLVKTHGVIIDCTSATKPATIAYYQLSEELHLPLIYVYEEKRQLVWLKTPKQILRQLGII